MPDLSEPGTRVSAIPKSFAARIGEAVRYAITGVTPATWFGPMQPLAPMAPEGTGGRRFDYPVGYNLQYQPRYDEPFSFATLRGLADTCDMLRLVIETRKDQIEAQCWDVRPRKRTDGTHPKASDFAAEIAAAKDFFAAPDREHDLAAWLRMIAEEMFVTDAVSLYLRPDRGGRVFAFEAIDGATIAPRIDAWGRTPTPPDVAYQQILHGVPAADFSSDQLVYFPRNRRPGHVYGYSPVEQVITTANILIRRSAHQLAYYTDGNLSDAMLVAPANMTVDQLRSWQDFWDSTFAGNLPMRRRGVWVPGGSDVKPLKQPVLNDGFDELLARIICFAFSISPQPFVSMMNRATAETAHDAALSEGLLPVLNYFERLFRILFDRMGWRDIEMVAVDDRETDAKTADEIDVADVQAGIRTVNEVRAARGLDPLPDSDAPMAATGTVHAALRQAASSGQRAPLRKDFIPDLHPRWPAKAPDSQGGQFAPKGEIAGGERVAARDSILNPEPLDDHVEKPPASAMDDAVYRPDSGPIQAEPTAEGNVQVQLNRLQHDAQMNAEMEQWRSAGFRVVTNVSFIDASTGIRVVADYVVSFMVPDPWTLFIFKKPEPFLVRDVKTGDGGLTDNQSVVYPHIWHGGKVIPTGMKAWLAGFDTGEETYLTELYVGGDLPSFTVHAARPEIHKRDEHG